MFLDLFSGVGGFRLALERAGHECVGFCEIDKYARQTYKANFKTEAEVEWHDITTVTAEAVRGIGTVDIITGGFPCQSFSVAGKRGGFEDTRGTLFFEIARIAKQIKPRFLLLENVKGILSHSHGNTFATILTTLDELGYDAEWQIINSKDHGVPQNRERVFIVGHSRRFPRREVFPVEGTDGETDIKVVADLNHHNYEIMNRVCGVEGLSPTISTMQGGNRQPKILQPAGIYTGTSDAFMRNPMPGLSRTLKANKHDAGIIEPAPVLTPDRPEKRQSGRRFKEPGEPMFTLTAQDRHGVVVGGINYKQHGEYSRGPLPGLCRTIRANNTGAAVVINGFDGYRIRKLTPLEVFRLQGFPDSHHDNAKAAGVSNSQLYKQAGNAVTVNVVYEIAKRL